PGGAARQSVAEGVFGVLLWGGRARGNGAGQQGRGPNVRPQAVCRRGLGHPWAGGGPSLRPEEGAGGGSCALVESADPRPAPLPACGERSHRILRCDPGDSPSARSAENPPHPSPLPASGERELTSALVGIDGAAPIRCTQIEAAALAKPSA